MTGTSMAGIKAFISGGSAGIGYSIAAKLCAQGATVAITGRSPERGLETIKRLQEISPESIFIQCEASNAGSCQEAVAHASEHLGGFELMVSAGAQGLVGPIPFEKMTPEQIESSISSRLLARIFPVHAAIPVLREQGGGSILMITTDAARHVTTGESIIGATGASIILLTKALARELSRHKIRVNSVALTITSDTPSWDRIFSNENFGSRLFSKALERFPSGRAPTSDEVADTALFLLSQQSAQVNGQTISVNGGLSFGGW